MNRIFFALIVTAFLTAAGRQVAYDLGYWWKIPVADGGFVVSRGATTATVRTVGLPEPLGIDPGQRVCRVAVGWAPPAGGGAPVVSSTVGEGCAPTLVGAVKTGTERWAIEVTGPAVDGPLFEYWYVFAKDEGGRVRVLVRQAHDQTVTVTVPEVDMLGAPPAGLTVAYPTEPVEPGAPSQCVARFDVDASGKPDPIEVTGCAPPYARQLEAGLRQWHPANPQLAGAALPLGLTVGATFTPSADPSVPGTVAVALPQPAELGDRSKAQLREVFVAPMQSVTTMLFDGVKAAVITVVLPLIGAMAFFLGVMKIAEKGGALLVMAKVVRPLMTRLFPDVPPNHPAMSAMILNIAANALGLGNAATPFGLRAMQELDKLNPEKGTATNAMALFLAINTSAVTLLATGVMSMRAGLGSHDPAGVIPTTLMATTFATVGALTSCKILERFVPGPKGTVSSEALAEQSTENDGGSYPAWVSLTALALLVCAIPLTVIYGEVFGKWIVPIIVAGFVTWGFVRGVAVYDAFIEGAREGFEIAVRIIPYLAAILGTVGMLRGSGAIDAFTSLVGPLTAPLGMPAEAVPMVLLRPLSGSGASGYMVETMHAHGPDSYIGYLVSTMQGSSETTFYVLAVYFGSVGVSRMRHAMVPGLIADLCGAIGSVVAVQLYFHYNGLSL